MIKDPITLFLCASIGSTVLVPFLKHARRDLFRVWDIPSDVRISTNSSFVNWSVVIGIGNVSLFLLLNRLNYVLFWILYFCIFWSRKQRVTLNPEDQETGTSTNDNMFLSCIPKVIVNFPLPSNINLSDLKCSENLLSPTMSFSLTVVNFQKNKSFT